MNLMLIGDLHFRSKKLKDIQTAWAEAVGLARKNKVDLIVQAGDCFDAANVYGREASTGTIYNAFLEPFVKDPIRLFLIPGNHDIGSPRDKDALAPIDRYEWLNVVRKPTIVEMEKGLSICAVPWLNRLSLVSRFLAEGLDLKAASARVDAGLRALMGKLGETVKKHKANGNVVLFVGHLEVTGASIGTKMQSGGTFEFSPSEIAGVGADAYALGHIHQRQAIPGLPNPNDGYLGTLCQLNFGEEKYKSGIRMIEVADGEVRSDTWVENSTSPRYYTVGDLKEAPYRAGIDYVKVRGTDRPESLPEGVMFEKIPVVQTKQRDEVLLGADSDIKELLAAWQKHSGNAIPMDRLLVRTVDLQNACTGKFADAIGLLDHVHEINLKDVTCHKDTKISLPKGICALAGPNGSGKTTAVEAIMLALYGSSPSRPSISSLLPSGSKDSSVEVVFSSGGKRYAAKREFTRENKKVGHKAVIYDPASGDPIATGAEGCLKFIKGLVGDPKLVLAGVFSSQGDGANLVKQDPADRKQLFAKCLGTEKFIQWAEAARKQISGEQAIVDVKKVRQSQLATELSGEAAEIEARKKIKEELEKKQKELTSSQGMIKTLTLLLTTLDSKRLETAKKQKDLEAWNTKIEGIKTNGRALKQRKTALAAIDGAALEKKIAEAEGWLAESIRIGGEALDATKRHFEAKEAVSDLEECKRLESQGLVTKVNDFQVEAQAAKRCLDEAKRRSAMLGNFPDVAACKKCPLAVDGIESRDSIPELDKKLKKAEDGAREANGKLQKFTAEVVELVRQKKAAIPDNSDALIEQKNSLAAKAGVLPSLKEQLKKYEQSKAEGDKLDALLEAERASLKDAQAQADKVAKEIKDAGPFDQAEYQKATSDKKTFEGAVEEWTDEIATFNRSIGEHDSKIKHFVDVKKEIAELDGELLKMEDSLADLGALALAYGRDGIPQIIVDSAIPHLQDIMYKMLAEIEGRWSIRIATQKETQKGTVQESINILVDDGQEERDISTYSGGEMNLLSTVVRVAFSVLQAERSGRGVKVLVLDEAMYFADSEYAEAFMRMLQNLAQCFTQILVVSHSDQVLASIRNKIFFAKPIGGKTTVQFDFEGPTA